MKIEDASKGTWLGHGHPLANSDGYAADDPKQEALYLCDHCEEVYPESEMKDDKTCQNCDDKSNN